MGRHAAQDEEKIKRMSVWMLSILCTMAHVPSLMLRYVPFREKTDKKQRIILLCCYGIGLAGNVLVYLRLARAGLITVSSYKVDLIVFCIIMAVVNILVIRGYVKEQLFTFGITALEILMILAAAAYITDLIGYETIEQGLIIENILGLIIYAVLYPGLRKLMRDTVTPFLDMKVYHYWNTIWFIPIAMFLGSVLAFGKETYTATLMQLVSRLLIGAATLLLCKSIAKDYQNLQKQEEMTRQMEQQKGYYQALTEAVRTEREARHDFKHQIVAVRGYLESGNAEELQEYCDMAERKLMDIAEIPYTGNAAADGVLYHYACMAKEKQIAFSVCCSLSDLTMSDSDLCCILGNALDNAVTACASWDGERKIRVMAKKEHNIVLITVDNTFDGVLLRKDGKILSKKRKNEEGIGIGSMKKICEKYGGTCEFRCQGNLFEASFFLMTDMA